MVDVTVLLLPGGGFICSGWRAIELIQLLQRAVSPHHLMGICLVCLCYSSPCGHTGTR